MQRFYTAYFNPYLNYHRPCGFATVQITERGKRKRRYQPENYRTPYEELLSLPHWEHFLKPGVPVQILRQQATRRSDTFLHREDTGSPNLHHVPLPEGQPIQTQLLSLPDPNAFCHQTISR